MIGGMQDVPLTTSFIIDHVAREHGAREVVTRYADGRLIRSNWAQVGHAARQCAQLLESLGIQPGDRVATLAMNHGNHLAAWYGAMGMGGVMHTINPRLFDDQIVFIANHAGDRVLFFDAMFAPIVDRLKPRMPSIDHYICFDSLDTDGFDARIASFDGAYGWRDRDEREPCMLCYTSGTTGNPKGVLYTHRSTFLHALASLQPDSQDLSADCCGMPIVPMFHACAWGTPFAAAMAGAKLVMSATNEPAVLCDLMHSEGVTHSAGVPTVWLAMFAHIDATGATPPPLKRVVIGGAAAPRAMLNRLLDMGMGVSHLWGMTELSPIGTSARLPANFATLTRDEQLDLLEMQGGAIFGIGMRIIDGEGNELPRDGKTSGRLEVRGPWVVERYFGDESGPAVDADGWFDTGDVAVIHPNGVMQIKDRAKDVIKSGGEWISSAILENEAMGCPGVAEAAAIGIPHPKWDERPMLLIVRKEEGAPTEDQVRDHLSTRIAKWWMPDKILFVDSLPHTATGKLLKTALREQYASAPLAQAG